MIEYDMRVTYIHVESKIYAQNSLQSEREKRG